MKKLIINADDFGYSAAVNAGIIYSHQYGILTSATLMANMPGTMQAIELSKCVPTLGVGCHLVLTIGKPILKKQSNMVDEKGEFFHLKNYKQKRKEYSDDDIYEEWCAQIEFLLSQGVRLTHLDSHHHVHAFQENIAIANAIAKKYGLVLRNCNGIQDEKELYSPEITKTDFCYDLMNTNKLRSMERSFQEMKKECLLELQENLNDIDGYPVAEIMVHPAFVDEKLYFQSSFHIQRMREVEILCDKDVKEMIQDMQFEFTNYHNV